MKTVTVFLMAIALAGCAARAKMAEKNDALFELHNPHVIERDLAQKPQEEDIP